MLYRWQIVVRERAILASHAGLLPQWHGRELRFDVAIFLILGVAVLSIGLDARSCWLRRRLRIEMLPARLADMLLSSHAQG